MVTGTPRIALTVGNTTVYATYASGSGTSALEFTYIVQSGDFDSDGVTVGSLSLNGGTISDAAGNAADTTLNSFGSTASVLVNGIAAPTLTGLSPSSGPTAGGTSVVLTGTDFIGATEVSFGGTPATSFTVDSATQITATAPAGSGTARVTVTTPGGTSLVWMYTYIAPPSLSPAAGVLTVGTVGSPYSVTFSASGAALPVSFAVTAGALPAGLNLDASTGELTGTPTAAGSYNFTVTLTDNAGATASAAYSLAVRSSQLQPSLSLSPSAGGLTAGTVGSPYAVNFAASGGGFALQLCGDGWYPS